MNSSLAEVNSFTQSVKVANAPLEGAHPLIQLERIHKIYSTGNIEMHALRGVSLSVYPAEFVAIMGASGSGKSTMMNILGCLDRPTRGTYVLGGKDVSQ